MGSLIPLIPVLVVGAWVIVAYNGLVSLKNQTIKRQLEKGVDK